MSCVRSILILFVALVCLCLHPATCAKSIISFSRREVDNSFFVSCTDSGRVDGGELLVYSSPSDHDPTVLPDNSDGFYTVNVTLEEEKVVACKAEGEEESERLEFYAIPVGSSQVSRLLAFPGEVTLMCSYRLGNLNSMRLGEDVVYGWTTTDEAQSKSINVTVPMTTMPSCYIFMKLCSGSDQCMSESVPSLSERISFSVTVVEPISICEYPVSQWVPQGSEAVFHCSANGSNVEIVWNFDGNNYTSRCNNDGGVCAHYTPPTATTNFVNSTLRVNATSNVSNIQCIVRQAFDGSIPGVQNSNFGNKLAESYLSVPPVYLYVNDSNTMITTWSGTDGITPSDPKLITIQIVAIVVAVTALVIIFIIIFCLCYFRRKSRGDDDSAKDLCPPFSSNSAEEEFPTLPNSNVVHPKCFQGTLLLQRQDGVSESLTSPVGLPSNGSDIQPRQDPTQEPIYNGSQYSGVSGGSGYSGLSGISNQDPGISHHMPHYHSGTDVSGTSFTQPVSTLLVPPQHPPSNGSRSRKCSDGSDKLCSSHHSSGLNQARKSSNGSDKFSHSNHSSGAAINLHQPLNINANPQLAYVDHQGKAYHYIVSNPGSIYPQGPFSVQSNHLPCSCSDPHLPHTSQSYPHLAFPYNQPYALYTPSNIPDNTHVHHSPSHFVQESFQGACSGVPISAGTVKTVLESLMHNRYCQIPNCPCKTAQDRYTRLINQPSANQNSEAFKKQSSNGSGYESDSTTERKRLLHLNLVSDSSNGEKHPHYHATNHTRPKRANPKVTLDRRRSRSVDLTPVVECSETPAKTPRIGAALLAGTPIIGNLTCTLADGAGHISNPCQRNGSNCTQADVNHIPLPQKSMSADDLPALCLNDCPFTPTPMRENRTIAGGSVRRVHSRHNAALSSINEANHHTRDTDNNTVSYNGQADDVTESINHPSLEHCHWNPINGAYISREVSQGYHSEVVQSENISMDRYYHSEVVGSDNISMDRCLGVCARLEPTPSLTSASSERDRSHRSNSPAYSTIVTQSDNGSVLHTTEC